MSLLALSEILEVFVNALTVDDKYFLHYKEEFIAINSNAII